jgi:hypothetical protein
MWKCESILAHRTISYGGHGNTTFSYPPVMLNKLVSYLAVLTHTFVASGTNNAVLQFKAANVITAQIFHEVFMIS